MGGEPCKGRRKVCPLALIKQSFRRPLRGWDHFFFFPQGFASNHCLSLHPGLRIRRPFGTRICPGKRSLVSGEKLASAVKNRTAGNTAVFLPVEDRISSHFLRYEDSQ